MENGWNQIWTLYGWSKLFSRKNKLFYFSLIVTVVTTISLNIAKSTTFELIIHVVDLSNSIMPTLLGFNLGAYALIIGFLSNKRLLEALVKKDDSSRFDRLQQISGVFAINIIAQAFTLLCSFLIRTFINLKITSFNFCLWSYKGTDIFNLAIFFIILFFTLYSVVLLIQNAINIFDFSQLFSHFATKEEESNNKPFEKK